MDIVVTIKYTFHISGIINFKNIYERKQSRKDCLYTHKKIIPHTNATDNKTQNTNGTNFESKSF